MTGWDAIWLTITLSLEHVATLQYIAFGFLFVALAWKKLKGR